jgi:micrococcal nuclease
MHKCRVRLYGIDTPESRTRDLDEKARGKLASKFLEDSINNGKEIILKSELKDSKGKYGRVLGSLIIDGLDINKAMVANNLAVRYFGQSKADVEAEHMVNRDILVAEGAYGALVKCRKVGAANWGNKTKKACGGPVKMKNGGLYVTRKGCGAMLPGKNKKTRLA